MDDLIRDFVVETLDDLDVVDAELVRFEREPDNQAIIQRIYRLLHTIKGTCGFLALHRLETLAHAAEGLIDRFRSGPAANRDQVSLVLTTLDRVKSILATLAETGSEPVGDDAELVSRLHLALKAPVATPPPPADVPDAPAACHAAPAGPAPTGPEAAPEAHEGEDGDLVAGEPSVVRETVRVGVARLENLMAVVSELVLVRNQLLEISRRGNDASFKAPIQRLSQITGELQDGVMRTRMQPLSGAWVKLSRVVRDIAKELGKDIRIRTEGADTEIDRQILDVVKDCIVHLVRNAADHGIESAEERTALGKPRTGSILLKASQQAGHILLEVTDDGRGIDIARLRSRAAARGVRSAATLAAMNDVDVARLIFEPGFSTAQRVTSLSGRGMGLDAVRTGIVQLGGSADLINRPGQGLTILIKLPLTLAIAPVLILEAGGQRYALPQIVIAELVKAQPGTDTRIEILGGTPTLRMRDTLLPLVDLVAEFGLDACAMPTARLVVVCHAGASRFGILVDAVHQTEETVVKPLPSKLKSISYFSGATILGDGSVVLILEASTFAAIARVGGEVAETPAEARPAQRGPEKTALLVYRAGVGRARVVPLPAISRLEEFDTARIDHTPSGYLIQYYDRLTRLVPGGSGFALQPSGEPQPTLMFSHGGRTVGLLVDEVIDVVEHVLQIDVAVQEPGYLGSAIVNGEVMDVLDVGALFGDAPDGETAQGQGLLLITASDFFKAVLVPLLQSEGYQVQTAADVGEARRLAQAHPPAGVVLDLDAAAEDMLALAAELQDGGLATRLVGIATSRNRGLVERAMAAGLADVVGKFDRRALIAGLKRRPAERELAA